MGKAPLLYDSLSVRMVPMTDKKELSKIVEGLLNVGAHFGFTKTRRHPSVKGFILATKNRSDIIDLEKTEEQIKEAKAFLEDMKNKGKTILVVGTKPEVRSTAEAFASKNNFPSVTTRWIGGMLTNWNEVKVRLQKLDDLTKKKEKGERDKFIKKERIQLEKEMANMQKDWGGISGLSKVPDALIVLDGRQEDVAITEANKMNIPVVSISGTDCDLTKVKFPIVANDSSIKAVEHILNSLV